MTDEVFLLGFGGVGREIFSAVRSSEAFSNSTVVIFDDVQTASSVSDYVTSSSRFGGAIADLQELPKGRFCVSIGSGRGRSYLQEMAVNFGHEPVTIVDSASRVSHSAVLGSGCSILFGSWITSRVLLGDGTHVGYGCIVAHDSRIGRFTTLGPGTVIPGNCTVGEFVTTGAGVLLRPGIKIGDGAMLGAGAVVVKDVGEGETVVGNPARPLK